MKILDLPVEKREKLGSANSRRYCRDGKIPSVLYGSKRESIPLVFTRDDFDKVMRAHTALVRLSFSGQKQTALVREVTWDTFGEHIQHVDLQRVDMDQEIQLAVPIHVVGVPAGVAHGGALQMPHPELPVHSRVDSIPSEIMIDVSHLEVGDRITAGEVNYPEHVRAALPDDEPVCFVKEPKVQQIEAPVAEGEEAPAEGEGAPAEGEAAPAEGGEEKPAEE